MADLARLEAALVKADAAGDTEGARILAGEVRKMRAASPAEDSTLTKIAKVATAPAAAVGETALQLGTGLAGSVAGGLSGLGNLATNALGLTDRNPADTVAKVSDALTYEPRTAPGRWMAEGVAKPLELYAHGADWAGRKATDAATAIGLPAPAAASVGTAVNTGIQAAPMALGPIAKAIPRESAAAVAARAKAAALAGPADAKLAAAREAGLVVPPGMANGGIVSRSIEGLSGEPKVAKLASKKNAPTINDLIRKDVGLPDDVPLSREALANVRKEAGEAYEFVKSTGRVATDARYQADLHSIVKSYDTAAKDFSHRSENPFQKTLDGLRVKEMDAASAVEEVKLLRADADKAYRTGDKQLGKAFKDAGQALDDQLDRHLRRVAIENGQDPAIATGVADYRAARQRIAKAYAADKALNDATGNIDAAVYAAAKKKNAPLSGKAKQVADFASAFPRAAQRVERVGATGPTYMDLLAAAVSKEALLAGARPLARSALLSSPVQNSVMAPRTFGRPMVRSLQDLLEQAGSEAGAVGVSAGQR